MRERFLDRRIGRDGLLQVRDIFWPWGRIRRLYEMNKWFNWQLQEASDEMQTMRCSMERAAEVARDWAARSEKLTNGLFLADAERATAMSENIGLRAAVHNLLGIIGYQMCGSDLNLGNEADIENVRRARALLNPGPMRIQ